MTRKKSLKAKEPVRIRFKDLTNGNKSIYLDIYQDGKRSYEFLKLYIVPEINQKAKQANEKTLVAAQAIKSQRVLDITNGRAGIDKDYGNLLLLDWMRSFQSSRIKTGQSLRRAEQIGSAIKHIEAFNDGRKIKMRDVDEKYCKSFIDYLMGAKSRTATKNEKPLSRTSAHSYFIVLASALKEAQRQKIIPINPVNNLGAEDLKRLKTDGKEVGYLTIEEVRALIDCKYQEQNKILRQAFLFACFTGFRISDIRSLRWGEIKNVEGNYFVRKKMKKTQSYIDLPLPEQSLYWLPNRESKQDSDFVFPTAGKWSREKLQDTLPKTQWCVNTELRRWAKKAGLKTHITFHMSRHTYATTLITLGADLFTVQKLLGHKSIQTTQIYAELVGKKKRDAVNLLNKVMK